jgi:hypothetical protein
MTAAPDPPPVFPDIRIPATRYKHRTKATTVAKAPRFLVKKIGVLGKDPHVRDGKQEQRNIELMLPQPFHRLQREFPHDLREHDRNKDNNQQQPHHGPKGKLHGSAAKNVHHGGKGKGHQQGAADDHDQHKRRLPMEKTGNKRSYNAGGYPRQEQRG